MGRCGSRGGDPDQAVEDEAKNKSTTLFSSRASGPGCRDIIEDIGVAYALDGMSSVIVVTDMVGVGGSNDCIENGRKRGSGIGELGVGDFGKSFSCQVPGIKATGKTQVAVNVTPCPSSSKIINQSLKRTSNFFKKNSPTS
jgi:hypothetical protein